MRLHEIWVVGTKDLQDVRRIFRDRNTPLEAICAHSGRVDEKKAAIITFKSDENSQGALRDLEEAGAYFMPGV